MLQLFVWYTCIPNQKTYTEHLYMNLCAITPLIPYTHIHTHTHTHARWFLWFTGTFHRRNGFYTVQAVCAIALHLNLALTGDGAFLFSLKKTHSLWFISVLNYGDTENVLINHLLLVIPMSYPCHYTNLCHKPHKHAHTHTHTHNWWYAMLLKLHLLINILT